MGHAEKPLPPLLHVHGDGELGLVQEAGGLADASLDRRGSGSTAARRAPSRAACAVPFQVWNPKPKSMMAKTSMKNSDATIANSTAAAPASS